MQVPEGIRVAPVTASIMEHFNDERFTREQVMNLADGIRETARLFPILEKALRDYAADLSNCKNIHLVADAAKPIVAMTEHMGGVVAELMVMHPIHHNHFEDPVKQGSFLDQRAEVHLQYIAAARQVQNDAIDRLEGLNPVRDLAEALARLFAGR